MFLFFFISYSPFYHTSCLSCASASGDVPRSMVQFCPMGDLVGHSVHLAWASIRSQCLPVYFLISFFASLHVFVLFENSSFFFFPTGIIHDIQGYDSTSAVLIRYLRKAVLGLLFFRLQHYNLFLKYWMPLTASPLCAAVLAKSFHFSLRMELRVGRWVFLTHLAREVKSKSIKNSFF